MIIKLKNTLIEWDGISDYGIRLEPPEVGRRVIINKNDIHKRAENN